MVQDPLLCDLPIQVYNQTAIKSFLIDYYENKLYV